MPPGRSKTQWCSAPAGSKMWGHEKWWKPSKMQAWIAYPDTYRYTGGKINPGLLFERQNSFRRVKLSQLWNVTWKMKLKNLCSQVVRALLISRWLLSSSPWGGIRDAQSIGEKHSTSTVSLPLYFPSPQLVLHQTTRCTFLLTWCKYTPLPLFAQIRASVPFTPQHSTRSGTGYRVLQHLHEGLCGPSWGLIHNHTPNKLLQIQEIYLRCQCSWASDPVVAPESSRCFLLAAKKLDEHVGLKNCRSRLNFHVVIFSTGPLTAQQLTHLLTEKIAKAEDITIAKTRSSHQLFKS